jgi:hypothetical protein
MVSRHDPTLNAPPVCRFWRGVGCVCIFVILFCTLFFVSLLNLWSLCRWHSDFPCLSVAMEYPSYCKIETCVVILNGYRDFILAFSFSWMTRLAWTSGRKCVSVGYSGVRAPERTMTHLGVSPRLRRRCQQTPLQRPTIDPMSTCGCIRLLIKA